MLVASNSAVRYWPLTALILNYSDPQRLSLTVHKKRAA